MNTIGIYPGRFQPAHRGHLSVYNYMKKIVGPNNAYIATSDKTDPVKSPLNFREKQQIWTRHGVPIDKVVKVTNPYKAEEITHKFDPKNTSAIFFLSDKDAARIPYTNKQGQPAYFQPYKGNEDKLLPIEQHSYIAVAPTVRIENKPISGTTVREGLGSPKYTEPQKRKFFQWVFGWFDIALFEMLVDKFTASEQGKQEPIKEHRLKEVLKGIIRELVFSTQPKELPGETDTEDSSGDETDLEKDPIIQRKERDLARQKLRNLQQKQLFQKKQKEYRKLGIRQDDRDIKNTDSEIDATRKDI